MPCMSGFIPFRPHSTQYVGWFCADLANMKDRNDTLRCVPLSMELMIAASIFHLPCGCVAFDCQAWGMICMSGCITFRPHSTQQMGWFWADLAKNAQHRNDTVWCAVPLSHELMIAAGMVHLPCECVAMN